MFRDLRDGRALVTWDLPGESDPFTLGKYRAQSVQVSGEFGLASSVAIEGSNEMDADAQFALLNDPNGNPLIFYSPRIEGILEDCVKIAPKFVGDDPNAKVKVSILLFQVR